MTTNQDFLQSLVNDLGCKEEMPSIQELMMLQIQEQRRTNDVLQNLAESITELVEAMTAVEYAEEEQVNNHGGL